MKGKWMLWALLTALACALLTPTAALCERAPWDCPTCDRVQNTGNFCGGCGHEAPPTIKAGDHVQFGRFPQKKEGTDQTPIEWIVMETDGTRAVLLSRYVLAASKYNESYKYVTWENCTARKWLNSTFYETAFSAEEQAVMLLSEVNNDEDQNSPTSTGSNGNDTLDHVYLLSYAEVLRYFETLTDRRCVPTSYAMKMGVHTSSRYGKLLKTLWWLRSMGYANKNAEIIFHDGGKEVKAVTSLQGLRPVIQVDMAADPNGLLVLMTAEE